MYHFLFEQVAMREEMQELLLRAASRLHQVDLVLLHPLHLLQQLKLPLPHNISPNCTHTQ